MLTSSSVDSAVVRGHGDGSLYKRLDRGTWRCVVSMPDGSRQYRTAKTKAEAKVEATSGFEPLNRGFADRTPPARKHDQEHALNAGGR